MKKRKLTLNADLLCLFPIYLWIAVHSYPYFFESLTNNYREIQTYNLDSMVVLNIVKSAWAHSAYPITNNDYGHFYYNLTIAAASAYSLFAPVTERALFFILRLVSLFSGCFCIALVYLFARRFLGRLEGVFAAAVMAFSPMFVEFSTEIHPDILQLALLTLSLYFLARAFEAPGPMDAPLTWRGMKAKFGFVLASSAAAGAAFGTKYQGMFLLPLLALAAGKVPASAISDRFLTLLKRIFLPLSVTLGIGFFVLGRTAYPLNFLLYIGLNDIAYIRSGGLYWIIQAFRVACFAMAAACFAVAIAHVWQIGATRYLPIFRKLVIFVATGLAFLAAFAASSPWLLPHLNFLQAIYLRSTTTDEGEWYGFRWLSRLFGYSGFEQNFTAYGISALSLVGIAVLIVALLKRDVRARHLPFLFVLAFLLIFMSLMIAKINYVTPTYLIPAAPLLVLLAALGLHEIRGLFPRWFDRRGAVWAASALTALALGNQLWAGGAILMQYPNLVTALSRPNQQLGDWLTRCVPPDARVLAAAYSYAPPRLENVTVNMGPDFSYLSSINPQLVTIDVGDAAKAAEDEKTLSADPRYVPSRVNRFYDALLKSGAWQAGPTFMPYRVYVKASNPIVNLACR